LETSFAVSSWASLVETVMKPRFAIIALTVLAAGTAVAAEPTQAPAKDVSQQASRPARVMLASAEQVSAPAPADQSNPQPPKHRAARVTTCRCGDQAAEQPEQ
jgi:hypothetical protein